MSAVRLCPNADLIVVRLVSGKVLKPDLSKVPKGPSCVCRAIGTGVEELAWKGAHEEGVILSRHSTGEVRNDHGTGSVRQILRPVCKDIVRKPSLIWLVNVQHIDFVIPRPGIEGGRIGIKVDVAWTCSSRSEGSHMSCWELTIMYHFPRAARSLMKSLARHSAISIEEHLLDPCATQRTKKTYLYCNFELPQDPLRFLEAGVRSQRMT